MYKPITFKKRTRCAQTLNLGNGRYVSICKIEEMVDEYRQRKKDKLENELVKPNVCIIGDNKIPGVYDTSALTMIDIKHGMKLLFKKKYNKKKIWSNK